MNNVYFKFKVITNYFNFAYIYTIFYNIKYNYIK